jgi:hypothetical protein
MNGPKRLYYVLLLASATAIGAKPADAGRLSPADKLTAVGLASRVAWNQATDRTDTHPLDVQDLSIEVDEQKHRRRDPLVRVYQYHYHLRSARVLIFDLNTAQLINEQQIDSVHLPLNEQEISFAGQLLSARNDIVEQLRNEQRMRGRLPFQSLDELEVKASIFEPLDSDHICAEQRCALMSLFDDTNTVFSIEPVVNLQAQTVTLLDTQ